MAASQSTGPFQRRVVLPFRQFFDTESSSGIVLIATAGLAFLWANSPFADSYEAMKHLQTTVTIGGVGVDKSLAHWVNDFLMALFFFLVGLEIKRELVSGELRGWSRAALPVVGALGGMVGPALIYAAIAGSSGYSPGWGVPMATDIAFAVGVLALIGDRVPYNLKVFLLAFAIVDDLGAVIVIALFYTPNLAVVPLLVSLATCVIAGVYGRQGGGRPVVYVVLGAIAWYAMLKSGVHATIAGVLMALTVPLRHVPDPRALGEALTPRLNGSRERIEVELASLEKLIEEQQSPLHNFEHKLQPYVAYLIMPIFALFNAGVNVTSGNVQLGVGALAVFVGLLLGKPIGIVGAVWLGAALKLYRLPPEMDLRTLTGLGLLGGIGFTMSLFIAGLAFPDQMMLDEIKLGVLGASVVAALGGLVLLRMALPARATLSDQPAS
ncbi:Na+/H+ antiporter NhaA [Geminicoccus roseus]|uniref:Na+/H+ antiporter NhaA n=1 Tax=Geminicoccus roseus TaxID=404900 RepID=UPI000406F43E|nr:Na+/H+ antiporter NhaA [Geminicoccus roseus]